MTTLNVVYLFSVFGVLDTLYLMYHKFAGTDVACLFFPKEWCRKVQYAKQSVTFGIPNSIAGFVMYLLILFFAYQFSTAGGPWWPVQALVAFGFAFSLYFTYVQAFVLRAFCTWCVISFINFTLMFWAVWL